jgi:uridine monophosphate synthetase
MASIVSQISDSLFNSGCLRFGSFRIKSGALSPYYIDLASLLSSPKDLCSIAELSADKIAGVKRSRRIDKLASIELKGALVLPSIGCRTGLPCIVVRKEQKAYGVTGRIAGANVAKGDNILFFDDVISEGLSKLEGIKPLEELGAKVTDVMVVLDREQGGVITLEKAGYNVHALSRVSELAESLFQTSRISKEHRDAVLDYIKKKP